MANTSERGLSDLYSATERFLALSRIPLLSRLDSADLHFLAQHTRLRFHPAGSVVVPEGEFDRAVVYLRSNEEAPSRDPAETGALGLLGMLAGARNEEAVLAKGRAFVLELRRGDLSDLLEARHSLLLGLLDRVCRLLIPREVLVEEAGAGSHRLHRLGEGDEWHLLDRCLLLRDAFRLRGAHLDTLMEAAERAAEVRMRDGEPLCRASQPASHLHVVMDGAVNCVRLGREGDAICYPGSLLGVPSGVTGLPRGYDAAARGDTRLLELPMDLVFDFLDDHPPLAKDVLRALTHRLLAASRKAD